MLNEEKLKKELEELFENMDDGDLINCWNEYCWSESEDDVLYCMCDFDELFSNKNIFEVVEKCCYGDFNPIDDYFKFDENGRIDSFPHYYLRKYVDIDKMINYIIETEDYLCYKDIAVIIEDCQEQEEEEITL